MASPGEANATSRPSSRMVPAVGWSTPNSTRAISVRPLPTRPAKPRISPARTSKRDVGEGAVAGEAARRQHHGAGRGRARRVHVAQRAADHQADGAVARHLGGRRRGDQLPVAQHGDAIGDAVDLVHAMADEHHRHALPAQVVDHGEQPVDLALRQGGGGLVHDQHAGVDRQCPGDLDQLLLGAAQAGQRRLGLCSRARPCRAGGPRRGASVPGPAGPARRPGHGR